jgi:H+/Cl- antiporter ClcA
MVDGATELPPLYVLMKFLATWLTTWSGAPAGIFAPSLGIGAAIGNDIGQLLAFDQIPALIALGMVGFLAAVTQAPLTSFIIVMEMVDGHAMVLSLMACALVATVIARIISPPLYPGLAQLQRKR